MKILRQPQSAKVEKRKKCLFLVTFGLALGFVILSTTILNAPLHLDQLRDGWPRSRLASTANWEKDRSKDWETRGNLRLVQSPGFSTGTTYIVERHAEYASPTLLQTPQSSITSSPLINTRILVAIAAFNFNQIPHLEEVLDSYHDICVGGAKVDVVIHATVAYPVTFIDLLNSRFTCDDFSIEIVLKPSSLKLHLADCHRELFYRKIDDYDLFIYTEEDIRVTPRTVCTYLQESRRIKEIVDRDASAKYSFSDFNVGIVRYEYNYPSNVIIDDKTRHAIQNVSRVYWEHSSNKPPLVPNTIDVPTQGKEIAERYITMANHHQGMFLATRDLLLAWRDRKNCNFHVAKNRPGGKSQPTQGTQRVWMSSQQLFGKHHCNVQQVLPKDKFGALTVLHVPNKNYRRVGKYRKRVFSDGTEQFEQYPDLLSALGLHLAMRKAWPATPQRPYKGPVTMTDEVTKGRTSNLERRLREYQDYVQRGGVLSDYDFGRTLLVEME